jgi:response regulator NasT
MRILIADDNPIVRVDLRVTLEEAGHVVCAEARDGLEAVALARDVAPDLAMLDVRMGGLHGIEAARRIGRERPIPIVIVTGYADYTVAEYAAASTVGASYLAKPFSDEEVQLAIDAAVAEHARRTRGSARAWLAARLSKRRPGRRRS